MSEPELSGVPEAFGEVLRRARTAKGISQEELAFRAGVDRTFIYRLEKGLRQPTISTIFGLGAALGMDAANLVRETEAQYRSAGSAQSTAIPE